MKVWLVVREDRHIDDEITVHTTVHSAVEAVSEFEDRYPDETWVDEDFTGYAFYMHSSHDDGPCCYVKETVVRD